MKKTFYNPQTVSSAKGNYSHAVEISGNFRQLFVSGQIPEKTDGEIPADFESQCVVVWENIGEILKSAEMDFNDIIKVTTFLTDRNQAEKNGQIRRKFLGDLRPALTVIIVNTLDSRWLLEIEITAAKEI